MSVLDVTSLIVVGLPGVLALYAYVGYPALLWALAITSDARPGSSSKEAPSDWPMVSISLPAYNEAGVIRGTLEALLAADYPDDRLQIVVVSDASDDGTDDIVREFADRGVELHRLEERSGKTAAENAAVPLLEGEITVNMDASIRIPPRSIKALVEALEDPSVGVASGRDVSVASTEEAGNVGESSYVGYEMWVRDLETRAGSIVGASGCFYAIRTELHRRPLPATLSRDFAAALVAREEGFRSVSVDDAVCYVPRTASLKRELRRKVRTMARGLGTLFYKRHLLDPFRYGRFAWMLFSHKLCRWLVPLTVPPAVGGLMFVAWSLAGPVGLGSLGAGTVAGAAILMAAERFESDEVPRLLAMFQYITYGIAAGVRAWMEFLSGGEFAVWEPTQR